MTQRLDQGNAMRKVSCASLLFIIIIVLSVNCQTVKTLNISGIWKQESMQVRLVQKGMFSWGEQAYNPLGTLTIDLDCDSPYINAAGLLFGVKEVLSTETNRITIIIIDWLNNNKEREICIEILNDNEIIVINDIFYPPSNTSKLYTRVPIDAQYEPGRLHE